MELFKSLTGWVLSVSCDLYQAGITEDGALYHAEAYTVMAEDARGSRMYHDKTWLTAAEKWVDDEGQLIQYFTDTRKEDRAQADALIVKIQKAWQINMEHWTNGLPCYGSQAYAANVDQYEAELDALDYETDRYRK